MQQRNISWGCHQYQESEQQWRHPPPNRLIRLLQELRYIKSGVPDWNILMMAWLRHCGDTCSLHHVQCHVLHHHHRLMYTVYLRTLKSPVIHILAIDNNNWTNLNVSIPSPQHSNTSSTSRTHTYYPFSSNQMISPIIRWYYLHICYFYIHTSSANPYVSMTWYDSRCISLYV